MVKLKKSKGQVYYFYASLSGPDIKVFERYTELLSIDYGAPFTRNDALAYLCKNEIAPKVERAEAILAGKAEAILKPKAEPEQVAESLASEPEQVKSTFNP